jgi:hypothetical protein
VVRGRETIDDVGGGDMVCKEEHVRAGRRKRRSLKQKVFGSFAMNQGSMCGARVPMGVVHGL